MNTEDPNSIKEVNINYIREKELPLDYYDEDIVLVDDLRQLTHTAAFKPDVCMLLLCIRGHFEIDINGSHYYIRGGDVIFCAPNVTLENLRFTPDFDGKALCLTNHIIQDAMESAVSVWNNAAYIYKLHVIHLDAQDTEALRNYYSLFMWRMKQPGRYRMLVIRSLVKALLLDFCNVLVKNGVDETPDAMGQGEVLFKKFIELVTNSKIKKRSVGEYADELCVSSKYLTVVCKNVSGKTASYWINEYVMEDIKRQLRNSDMTISEIVDTMGFPSISFFGKYVRKHLGVSPREYRKMLLTIEK